jgi:hypothetical protein
VGELGGDAWRPGEVEGGLGRHGTAASGDAAARQRENRGRRCDTLGVKYSKQIGRMFCMF